MAMDFFVDADPVQPAARVLDVTSSDICIE